MTVTSLNKCRSLDGFNHFSKHVQSDPISDGRSFVFTNPNNGKQRSYTMNQIVYQFEKCIKKSEKASLDNLPIKVHEGLKAIDQWNMTADQRTNTSMLLLRQLIGNLWFSIISGCWDKDETLDLIRAKYPRTPELLRQEFQNQHLESLGNFAILPEDIRDKMVSDIPLTTVFGHTLSDSVVTKCINDMKRFWRAPLGCDAVFGTIDAKKFARWIGEKKVSIRDLIKDQNLSNEDLTTLLPYLEYLDISNLDFVNFGFLKNCKNLKTLDFSNCTTLKDDDLKYLADLKNLQTLYLSGCEALTDEGMKYLVNIKTLQTLHLSGNKQLTDQSLKYVGDLKNLQILSLSGCEKLTDEGMKYLAGLKILQDLNLSFNQLTGEGFKYFAELKNLKFLNLTNCKELTGEGLMRLAGVKNLHSLALIFISSTESLTDGSLKYIASLKNLQSLYLFGNKQLTNQSLKYIGGLKNLQTLSLMGCEKLTDQGFKYLTGLQNLQSLDVSHCEQLTNEGLKYLAGLQTLQSLNVSWCWGVDRKGAQACFKACKIK